MPKRTDIKSVLIIGAGPIVIGQACEFDYSGTQACKALKEEGYRVILINSNPATIMTDPELADVTYIEPITPEFVEKIIAKERPEALLPTMGGQTALNTALALHKNGVLKKYKVELIGAKPESIEKAENRALFNEAMKKIGLSVPKNLVVDNLEDALAFAKNNPFPLIIRPSFTLGGTGGGIAYNSQEFVAIIKSGLEASPTNQVLIDESLLGWKEYEMEVVRDKNDNCIIVCSIENVDPMGVHTGDSITVAPALTLTDKEYQQMRNAAIAVMREIGVETGGSNVQFGVNPKNGKQVVIEMNPRVSRSSALASKATGFPIAKVATKLAIGYTLDEILNDCTKAFPASFEPMIDYVVTKIPRFAFDKFLSADETLGSAMKSVGEVMAIGSSFAESLQKALRSLESGLNGFKEKNEKDIDVLKEDLKKLTPKRILLIGQAFRQGLSVEEVASLTSYDKWFLEQIKTIIDKELEIKELKLQDLNKFNLYQIKKLGFSDAKIAELLNVKEQAVQNKRHSLGVHPSFKRIDTCAGEFDAKTPYMYSTYSGDGITENEDEASISNRKKVIILGSGPNRIGQGIEFDYACVHGVLSAQEEGVEAIMINCNPETVSTDYDTSDRLYFEPITSEDVYEIILKEKQRGKFLGVNVQFGGQTPLKLASYLEKKGIKLLGTSAKVIEQAEDRQFFQKFLKKNRLKQPENLIAKNDAELFINAKKLGFPFVLRPSFVLGGRAMIVAENEDDLVKYLDQHSDCFESGPLLLDKFLNNATEIDVDAISDGKEVFVCAIMEHIEEAGIHSGDSACSIPSYSLSEEVRAEITRQTILIAKKLKIIGLMNIQFALYNGDVFVLEVNPRSSRSVPYVAKSILTPIVKIAGKIMLGKKLSSFASELNKIEAIKKEAKFYTIKEVVFPFARFNNVDIVLGPEMKSTGEVMGIGENLDIAFAKSQIASGFELHLKGNAFVSVKDEDKQAILEISKILLNNKFNLLATSGTAKFLNDNGVKCKVVNKVREGSPHIVDMINSNQVQLVINTTKGEESIKDSFSIRRNTFLRKITYSTTIKGAYRLAKAIEFLNKNGGKMAVKALQELA